MKKKIKNKKSNMILLEKLKLLMKKIKMKKIIMMIIHQNNLVIIKIFLHLNQFYLIQKVNKKFRTIKMNLIKKKMKLNKIYYQIF